jgi:hypothetical protein
MGDDGAARAEGVENAPERSRRDRADLWRADVCQGPRCRSLHVRVFLSREALFGGLTRRATVGLALWDPIGSPIGNI